MAGVWNGQVRSSKPGGRAADSAPYINAYRILDTPGTGSHDQARRTRASRVLRVWKTFSYRNDVRNG